MTVVRTNTTVVLQKQSSPEAIIYCLSAETHTLVEAIGISKS